MRHRMQRMLSQKFAAHKKYECLTQVMQPKEIEPARHSVAKLPARNSLEHSKPARPKVGRQRCQQDPESLLRQPCAQVEYLALLEAAKPQVALDSHPPCKCPHRSHDDCACELRRAQACVFEFFMCSCPKYFAMKVHPPDDPKPVT